MAKAKLLRQRRTAGRHPLREGLEQGRHIVGMNEVNALRRSLLGT
jgi:hypothetical protein